MITSKPAIDDHPKTGQRRGVRDRVVLAFCLLVGQVHFGSPTTWTAFKDVTVVQQAIEHGGDRGAVTEQFSPILDRTIRRHHSAGPFIAAHDDLQDVLGRGGGELAHTEIIDDEQRHGGQQFHVLFARAVDGRFSDFIEQGVSLPVEYAVPLLDGGQTDGLGQGGSYRCRVDLKKVRPHV